jgi:large subunit ribosomal protein L9
VKVLLRRDVKGIGRRGDIVTVSSGHARNYLIPNGLAVEATEGAVAQAETLKRSRDVREAADKDSAQGWHHRKAVRLGDCQ